ncbi:MAG: M3 family oligoendopeptidase [Candidatus Bathyarchaeota archaeon]|nr:M3 family oligoendopeptidase [Candidatus Bathyarchaeota archaeon]
MAEEMRWDIAQLVESTDPEKIEARLDEMVVEASGFAGKYRGKIKALDAAGLRALLEARDAFSLRYEGAMEYCSLRYSADSTDAVSKRLNEAVRKAGNKAGQALAFAEIEMGDLLKAKPGLVTDPRLGEYRHFLERIVRRIPHVMTEELEKLTISKDQNGVSAWSQLQGDWLSTRKFKIVVDGVEKTMPYGEIISLYQSRDRALRREANRVVYDGLGRDDIVWASAIRGVCGDHLQMCEWRKYPSPMTQSLIDNDVEQGAIDALMRVMEAGVGSYRRYLLLKAKLMGLKKLGNWDIVAPLPGAPEKKYTWDESRREVVAAYADFDPEWARWVDEMYGRRHIDGEVRNGKRSGAFCASWLAGKSAWVMQSFNGQMGDVYTQAHELGHAVHAYMGGRYQKPSNYEIGSCIAETASVFGELLLTDRLLAEAKTKAEKRAILATVLDEFGMAAYQVSARVFFEESLYEAIKGGKFLDGETVSGLWTAGRDKIYGDAVEWLPEMKWEWTMKLHYYIPNYRFYNYPYVYAQLFVFALYRLYKEQGKAFVPKMRALLAAGSSRSPTDLAKEIGIDITEEDFWRKGIQQFEAFVDQLEATINSD